MSNLNAYLFQVECINEFMQRWDKYLWVFATTPRDAQHIISLRSRQHLEERRYIGPLDWFNGSCFTKPHEHGDIIQGYSYGR